MQDLHSGNIIKTEFGGTYKIRTAPIGEDYYICNVYIPEHNYLGTPNHRIGKSTVVEVTPTCHECGHTLEDDNHPQFGTKHFCDTDCQATYAL